MRDAARALVAAGARAVVVKGGHLDGPAVDVFCDGTTVRRAVGRARLDTRHTHGTGCTFSSAIAARLALGDESARGGRGRQGVRHARDQRRRRASVTATARSSTSLMPDAQ